MAQKASRTVDGRGFGGVHGGEGSQQREVVEQPAARREHQRLPPALPEHLADLVPLAHEPVRQPPTAAAVGAAPDCGAPGRRGRPAPAGGAKTIAATPIPTSATNTAPPTIAARPRPGSTGAPTGSPAVQAAAVRAGCRTRAARTPSSPTRPPNEQPTPVSIAYCIAPAAATPPGTTRPKELEASWEVVTGPSAGSAARASEPPRYRRSCRPGARPSRCTRAD